MPDTYGEYHYSESLTPSITLTDIGISFPEKGAIDYCGSYVLPTFIYRHTVFPEIYQVYLSQGVIGVNEYIEDNIVSVLRNVYKVLGLEFEDEEICFSRLIYIGFDENTVVYLIATYMSIEHDIDLLEELEEEKGMNEIIKVLREISRKYEEIRDILLQLLSSQSSLYSTDKEFYAGNYMIPDTTTMPQKSLTPYA